MQVPILKQGDVLIASIQAVLSDADYLQFSSALLRRVVQSRARGVIIDVASLDVMDSFGSRTLREVAETIRLLGAQTVIVGIPPEIAISMVQMGLRLETVHVALDLEEGLSYLSKVVGRRGDGQGYPLVSE